MNEGNVHKNHAKCARCGRQIVVDYLAHHLVHCNDDFMADDHEKDERDSLEDNPEAGSIRCSSLPISKAINPFMHRDHGQYGSFSTFDDYDEDSEP